jgi:hypothetical protein
MRFHLIAFRSRLLRPLSREHLIPPEKRSTQRTLRALDLVIRPLVGARVPLGPHHPAL